MLGAFIERVHRGHVTGRCYSEDLCVVYLTFFRSIILNNQMHRKDARLPEIGSAKISSDFSRESVGMTAIRRPPMYGEQERHYEF